MDRHQYNDLAITVPAGSTTTLFTADFLTKSRTISFGVLKIDAGAGHVQLKYKVKPESADVYYDPSNAALSSNLTTQYAMDCKNAEIVPAAIVEFYLANDGTADASARCFIVYED